MALRRCEQVAMDTDEFVVDVATVLSSSYEASVWENKEVTFD